MEYLLKLNPKRSDIYDLVEGPENTPLSFVRVSKPRQEYLKKQGAVMCLESWSDEKKIFFTGLRPIKGRKRKYQFNGDHYSNGIKYILQVCFSKDLRYMKIRVKDRTIFMLDKNKRA